MNLVITLGTLQLASATDAVSGFASDGEFLAEVQRGLRAELARPVPRGNALDVLSFRVTRQHATLSAAQQRVIEARMEVRGLAAGTSARFTWTSGGRTFAPWLLNVAVTRCACTHTGQTTFTDYTLQGNLSLRTGLLPMLA